MHTCTRRTCAGLLAGGLVTLLAAPSRALTEREAFFVGEAERMRRQAVASGDQSFGAIIVRNDVIIGYGPSRVIGERNPDAHAERVALRDAQRRTGSQDLAGAVIYSTSIPCRACQRALASASITAMRYGPAATDTGPPQAAR